MRDSRFLCSIDSRSLLVFPQWETSVEWRGEKKERKNILCSEMCKESFPCSVIPSVTSFLLWDRHPGHKTLDPFRVQNSPESLSSAVLSVTMVFQHRSPVFDSLFTQNPGVIRSLWQIYVKPVTVIRGDETTTRRDAIETSVSRRDGDGVCVPKIWPKRT